MGTLAGCLKRLNITGAHADLIRARAAVYKEEGLAPAAANLEAVQELLADTLAERQAVIAQLPAALQAQLPAQEALDATQTPERPSLARQADQPGRVGPAVRDPDRGAGLPDRLARRPPGAGGGVHTPLGLAQRLERHGKVDLGGLDVSTPAALAELAQVFRDRNVETLRVIVARDGKLLQHMGVTSRKPGMVVPFMNELTRSRFVGQIQALMLKTGATDWYLVHNHPSGNPEPSKADLSLTRFLEGKIPGFQGHVVVDHERFGYIGRQGETVGEKPYDIRPIANVDLRADMPQNPLQNRRIATPDDVATLGRAVDARSGYVVAIYTTVGTHDNTPRSVAIQEIPAGHVTATDRTPGREASTPIAGYLRNATRAFGANQVYLYLPEGMPEVEAAVLPLIHEKVIRDVVVERDGYQDSLQDFVAPDHGRSSAEQGESIEAIYRRTARVAESEPGYARPGPPPRPPKRAALTPAPKFTASDPTVMDDLRYLFQDQHIDVRKTVEDIQKGMAAIGQQAERLPDVLDPTHALNTYAGRQDARLTDFERTELQPLVDAMNQAGVTSEALNDYLMALTAEQANAYFQSINPQDVQSDLFDPGWDNTALSGMSNADAQAILEAADHETLRPLADRVFAMLNQTRALMVQYGEISQETRDQWEAANPLYIPRRREGFQDEEHEHGRPQGLAVQGKIVKTALGSQRKVVDVLGNVVAQRNKVINRGERMRPVLTIAAMFLKYPNKDFVRLTKPLTFTYIDPATGLQETITQGHDPGPMKRVWDPKAKQVKWVRNAQGFFADHVVPFKVNGVQYGLVFNRDNPRAKRMARGLKGKDLALIGGDTDKAVTHETTKQVAGLASTWASGTRLIASLNTQYSPAFGPWNFARDLLFASLTLENSPLKGQQWPIIRSAFANLKTLYQVARALRRHETPDPEAMARVRDFQMAGGQTGFRNLYLTGEEQAKAIEKLLHPGRFQQLWTKTGGQAIADWVQDYNTMFENAVRLATFEAAMRQGMSKTRAASMAKDVTVNFNRRGVKSAQLGALYAFFNVTLQSTERVITTMFDTTKGTLTPAGKKILYGGMALGSLQAFVLAMNGFEEDEPPEFVKVRNFLIPAPFAEKGYLAIPMPLGFNIIPNLGRLATEYLFHGGFNDKAMKFVDSVWGVADPLGGSSTALQTAAPTLLDPIAQLMENKDWTGRPIYREDFLATHPTPGHTRAHQDAGEWAVWLSKAVNVALGGTEYAPGFWMGQPMSPPPEVYEHLLAFIAGGPGREVKKVGRLTKSIKEDQPVELYNIPLVGRLIGVAAGSAHDWTRWREHMLALHVHDLELKGRKGDARAQRQYRKDHPLSQHVSYGRLVEGRLRKYLKRRRDLNTKPDSTLIRTEKRKLDERIGTLLSKFNERMAHATGTP